MKVVFDGGLLEHVDTRRTAKVIMMLLRALVECNLDYLEAHPDTPHPYRAGIRYRREQGQERIRIPVVVHRLQANGRLQIDLMFAALLVLALMAVALYYATDALLRRLVPWQPVTTPTDD